MDDKTQDQEDIDAFGALLMTHELCGRKLGKTPDCPATLEKLEETEGTLRELFKDYVEGLDQLHAAYQDIAKTYFDFVDQVEKELGLTTAPGEVDHDLILRAIKDVMARASAPKSDGPGIQAYNPAPADDPHFLLIMRPHQKGQWVKREDHQYSVGRLREGSEAALVAREQEITRLKEELKLLKGTATTYARCPRVDGSNTTHVAHEALCQLLGVIPNQKASNAPSDPHSAAKG